MRWSASAVGSARTADPKRVKAGISMRTVCVVGVCLLLPTASIAQTADVPRTARGVPDLSGYWEYRTSTPLQRPEALAGKAVLTPEETAAYLPERLAAIGRERDLQLNADWWEPGGLTDSLHGGPRLAEPIRQWQGDSRGHWDGDTLVVETANFNGKWTLSGAGAHMRLVERFTVTDADALAYEVTVEDAESFAGPWTVAFPITRAIGPLFENACHEGNHSMPLILNGARAQERATEAVPR